MGFPNHKTKKQNKKKKRVFCEEEEKREREREREREKETTMDFCPFFLWGGGRKRQKKVEIIMLCNERGCTNEYCAPLF